MVMVCPQEIVPSMIGRGGETVGMMEKEAGAKIVFSNKILFAKISREVGLTEIKIFGSDTQCEKAAKLLDIASNGVCRKLDTDGKPIGGVPVYGQGHLTTEEGQQYEGGWNPEPMFNPEMMWAAKGKGKGPKGKGKGWFDPAAMQAMMHAKGKGKGFKGKGMPFVLGKGMKGEGKGKGGPNENNFEQWNQSSPSANVWHKPPSGADNPATPPPKQATNGNYMTGAGNVPNHSNYITTPAPLDNPWANGSTHFESAKSPARSNKGGEKNDDLDDLEKNIMVADLQSQGIDFDDL
jgi:hypothetical protein